MNSVDIYEHVSGTKEIYFEAFSGNGSWHLVHGDDITPLYDGFKGNVNVLADYSGNLKLECSDPEPYECNYRISFGDVGSAKQQPDARFTKMEGENSHDVWGIMNYLSTPVMEILQKNIIHPISGKNYIDMKVIYTSKSHKSHR